MVDDYKKVKVSTSLTRCGELEFIVTTSKGSYRNKCIHDALSNADIKMTGIGEILTSYRLSLEQVKDFKISKDEFRQNRKD